MYDTHLMSLIFCSLSNDVISDLGKMYGNARY